MMSIGNSFEAAMMKAVSSIELGMDTLTHKPFEELTDDEIVAHMYVQDAERVFCVYEALKRGIDQMCIRDRRRPVLYPACMGRRRSPLPVPAHQRAPLEPGQQHHRVSVSGLSLIHIFSLGNIPFREKTPYLRLNPSYHVMRQMKRGHRPAPRRSTNVTIMGVTIGGIYH